MLLHLLLDISPQNGGRIACIFAGLCIILYKIFDVNPFFAAFSVDKRRLLWYDMK